MSEVLTQTRYRIEGMDCASCASKIDTAVRRIDGVSDVAVSVTAGTMMVQHNAKSDLTALQKKVTGLGYSIAPLTSKPSPTHSPQNDDHTGHDHADHPAMTMRAKMITLKKRPLACTATIKAHLTARGGSRARGNWPSQAALP